jgi:hypothetical protein
MENSVNPSDVNTKMPLELLSSSLSEPESLQCDDNVESFETSAELTKYVDLDPIRSALRDIYAAEPRNVFSVVCTGGGGSIAGWLFSTPGGSNSIMECKFPYSRSALEVYMGNRPYPCTQQTAVDMSRVVYRKTVELFIKETGHLAGFADNNNFGVACSAALVSSEVLAKQFF